MRTDGTEVAATSTTGGRKNLKPARYSGIDPTFLHELALLCGIGGAIKYGDMHNYRLGYPLSSSYDAAQRHIQTWWTQTEDIDPETGVHHLISAAWHLMCMYVNSDNPELEDFDDRPSADLRGGERHVLQSSQIWQEYIGD